MHIVYINPPAEYYSPISGGAIATVVMEQTRELIARGHEVTIITVANNDPTYAVGNIVRLPPVGRATLNFVQRRLSALKQKITPWDWPFYDYHRNNYARALRRLARQPDVLIVHNDLVASPFLKRMFPGAKVLVWLHNEQRTNQRSLAGTIKETDAFVAVSRCTLDWTVHEHSIPPEKAFAIHNAANMNTFTPRADLKPGPDGIRVLFLGRIDRNKGPDLVTDAVAILQKKGVAVRLSVAGALWWYNNENQMADPYMRQLKDKMDSVGATYHGLVARPDVPELIRAHDVVCVLSRTRDPCPMVGLEAMASGCALLSTDRGGLPEVCGDAALIVNPDDFRQVVDGLTRLTTNPQTLMDYKHRGLQQARTNTWTCRAAEFDDLLARLFSTSRQMAVVGGDSVPRAAVS
jgi:glycosyltransferase involved in cell wall biosynthesis